MNMNIGTLVLPGRLSEYSSPQHQSEAVEQERNNDLEPLQPYTAVDSAVLSSSHQKIGYQAISEFGSTSQLIHTGSLGVSQGLVLQVSSYRATSVAILLCYCFVACLQSGATLVYSPSPGIIAATTLYLLISQCLVCGLFVTLFFLSSSLPHASKCVAVLVASNTILSSSVSLTITQLIAQMSVSPGCVGRPAAALDGHCSAQLRDSSAGLLPLAVLCPLQWVMVIGGLLSVFKYYSPPSYRRAGSKESESTLW